MSLSTFSQSYTVWPVTIVGGNNTVRYRSHINENYSIRTIFHSYIGVQLKPLSLPNSLPNFGLNIINKKAVITSFKSFRISSDVPLNTDEDRLTLMIHSGQVLIILNISLYCGYFRLLGDRGRTILVYIKVLLLE